VAIFTAPVQLVFAIRTGRSEYSVNFSVIADSSLSKLLYLPLEELNDSNECHFF